MKVLEEGKNWSIQERCNGIGNGGGGCNALLEIEKEDIYITCHTDYLGEKDYYYTFCCPQCKMETDINQEKIPYKIRNEKLIDYKGSFTRHREWR